MSRCLALSIFLCLVSGCFSSSEGNSYRVVNRLTGEERTLTPEESVPDGFERCPDDGCPTPLACGDIDAASCAARSDCELAGEECVALGTEPDECGYDECGPIPPGLPCPDGTSTIGPCLRNAEGTCHFQIHECTFECTETDCGPPPPLPMHVCEDGSISGTECARNEAGECNWQARECQPISCEVEECGPPPPPFVVYCDDGTVSTGECAPNTEGACSWQFLCPGNSEG